MEATKKVVENTPYKLTIETDDGAYRLTFTRRYDTEVTATGRSRYVYRGWNVKAYHLAWGHWKSCDASHIPANYKDKKTIIAFISQRPAFSRATSEINN
jgi:hypothetical protein|nr:MAG TPA: protein of unknown function DUF4468 [Caudoviricetes sp.]